MFTDPSAILVSEHETCSVCRIDKNLVSKVEPFAGLATNELVRRMLAEGRSAYMRPIRILLTTLVLAVTAVSSTQGAVENGHNNPDRLFQERTYLGKPLTFWLKALRDRDEENLSDAFGAIHSLGSDAWVAVPELSRVVAAPFEPIRIGSDSEETIASKLYDISVRTEAIETLGWIGEPAAASTPALIKWGLMQRISMDFKRSPDNNVLFIELVGMDAEQRMHVAGAIAQLGPDTFPLLARMLASSDAPKRKLAVAILGQDALPVATDLLESGNCEERRLGLQILKDMDLVVARAQIDELSNQIGEICSMLTKLH